MQWNEPDKWRDPWELGIGIPFHDFYSEISLLEEANEPKPTRYAHQREKSTFEPIWTVHFKTLPCFGKGYEMAPGPKKKTYANRGNA